VEASEAALKFNCAQRGFLLISFRTKKLKEGFQVPTKIPLKTYLLFYRRKSSISRRVVMTLTHPLSGH